jgi:hypothetical protein
LPVLAGTFAIADMKLKADFEFSAGNILIGKLQIAVTDGIKLPGKIKECMHKPYVGIGPEILGSVADNGSRAENPWKRFIFDADPGKGFVVLEAYIIMRAVFLDEVIFEQKGILFRGNYDIFDVGYFSHQHLHLSADRVDLDKIRVDPFLQVLCFPHIDNTVFFVKILVNPGFIRQRPDNGFEMGKVFIKCAHII